MSKKGKKKRAVQKQEIVVKRPSTSDTESSVNFDLSDVEYETTVVRFSSASSSSSPTSDTSPDQLNNLHFDQEMLIDDALEDPCDIGEPLFNPSNRKPTYSITQVSPIGLCTGLPLQNTTSSQSTSSSEIVNIPRAPNSIRCPSVQFFLAFHRETITESYYFRYYDYPKFCTSTLLVMAENSDALQHALVAFSALVYSTKMDRTPREQAFLYYSMALRQLRALLDEHTMNEETCHIAIATALQLSSFDVFSFPSPLIPAILW